MHDNTFYPCSKVTDTSKAMLIMELPAGANKEKKDIALQNLEHILEKAHAVRCPGFIQFVTYSDI